MLAVGLPVLPWYCYGSEKLRSGAACGQVGSYLSAGIALLMLAVGLPVLPWHCYGSEKLRSGAAVSQVGSQLRPLDCPLPCSPRQHCSCVSDVVVA